MPGRDAERRTAAHPRSEGRRVQRLYRPRKDARRLLPVIGLIGALAALSGHRRAKVLGLPLSALSDSGIRCGSAKVRAGEVPREYLIEWSLLIEQLVAETNTVRRRVGTLFLFPTLDSQPLSDRRFKCLWNRLVHGYVKAGEVWLHTHDLRAMYVSVVRGKGQNPNTHENEKAMRRVYERRGTIEVPALGKL